jgi:hypothetical protein
MTEAAKIALEEKRHKEIAGLLSEVKAAVMSKKDNAGLEQLFNKLTDKIQPPKMPDIPAPNVSVQVDERAEDVAKIIIQDRDIIDVIKIFLQCHRKV